MPPRAPKAARAPKPQPVPVALALQGGGTHTAFGWGVLESLLQAEEEGAIRIVAVSGTSGGAFNAAALAAGLTDGPSGARRRLEQFWDAVVAEARYLNPFTALPVGLAMDFNIDATPLAMASALTTQLFSPYTLGLSAGSLARVIDQVLPDLAALAVPKREPALYVCATQIERTERAVFASPPVAGDAGQNPMPPVTPEALLASACVPQLFPAVHTAQGWMWDGGFLGNPALEPLLGHADDIIIVAINPLERDDAPPRTATAILDRVNEIAFNAALLMEVRAIERVNAWVGQGLLPGKRRVRLHRIADDAAMARLGFASKLNPNHDFVRSLRLHGRKVGNAWRAEFQPGLGDAARPSPLAHLVRKVRAAT
jgi:NTE family protein